MTTNWAIGIVLILLIAGLFIWVVVGGKKKRWYKVFTADNNCHLLYRDWNERMWRTNSYYLRFKDETDHEYTFPANGHWVLMMVEVKDDEREIARNEIESMRKVKQEESG